MNKIYILAGMLVVGSLAYGQNMIPLKPKNSVVHAGEKYSGKMIDAKHQISESINRGTPYFADDFEMGFTGNNLGSEPSTGAWVPAVVTGPVGFEITTVGHANDAGSTFTIPALLSTTGLGASGQWVLLDSDSDGAGGQPEEATLTSPQLDFLSVTNNSLSLEFQQFFAEWTNPVDDSIFIEVSTDGSTWTRLPSMSDGVGRDNRPNPEVVRVNLTSLNLAGEGTVWFRFLWTGEWNYGWQIDDVAIIDLPPNNLRLNTALATHNAVNAAGNLDKIAYTQIPSDQVFDMSVLGNVSNLGADPQTNVTVNGTSGAYVGVSPAIGLAPGEDSTLTCTQLFSPSTALGTQNVDIAVSYTNVALEDDPNGIIGSYSFEITQNVFSRDRDDYNGTGLWNGDDGNGITEAFIIGNMYQIENNTNLDAVKVALSGNTAVGALMYATIHSYDVTTGEFTLMAQSDDYTVQAADVPAAVGPGSPEVTLPFQTSVAVTGGESYLVSIGHYGGPDAVVLANSTSAQASALTTYLFSGTDLTWYYLTSVPMVRAQFNVLGVNDIDNNGIELGQNQPNPFNGNSTISYSLENAGNVSLEIMDLSGKVVATYTEGNKGAGAYTININADQLAAGIYNYTLKVDGNRMTKKMIVTK